MKQHHDGKRVELDGEWDLARKEELLALLDRLKMDGDGGTTIDLRKVTYADSTVLAALAGLALRFQERKITLLGPKPNILRLLKLVRFDDLFNIVDAE